MKCQMFAALIVCVAFGPSAVTDELSAASFQPLGEHYYAYGVSADGSVVVGVGYPQGFPGEAFRWTQSSGWVGLGFLPGGDSSAASAASADGSVIVGHSNSNAGTEAFRWTAGGGMVGLGDLPGGNHYGDARAVSDDGSVIVGASSSSVGAQAYRWTQASGMVPLNVPGYARGYGEGISGDGLVVVGDAGNVQGSPEAFRWTSGSAITLGGLPGGRFDSLATSASFDGAVVVGYGSSAANWEEAFRWTESSGMVGLGVLPSSITNPFSEALDVSADGAVIVGVSGDDVRGAQAFLWDAVHGMRSLQDVLSAAGIDLTGWQLHRAYGVSADGTVIVGEGDNPAGHSESFRAVVPEPSGFGLAACVGALALAIGRPRRSH